MKIKKNGIGKITIIIVFLTILTKIFGAGRDLVLSYFYGSTSVSDTYILATTLPVTIFAFIYEGIGATFVPACSKLKTDKEKNKLTSNMITLLLYLTLIFVVFIEIFPEFTIKLFASGFSGDTLSNAVFLIRISILGVFFSGIVYVFSYYLNYNNSFISPTLRAIPKDIVVILSIIVSFYTNSIFPLAVGIPLSLFFELLFLIPFVRKKGYKYDFSLKLDISIIRNIIIWSLPIVISTAVADLNTIIDRQFASRLISGGISSLTYSDRTLNVIRTTLFIPIITVLFPVFSKKISEGKHEIVSKIATTSYSMLILVALPLSCATFCLSNEIISILFQRGAFDSQATLYTGVCLKYYSVALIGYAIIAISTKVFYAMTDMKTPMFISIIGVVINIIFNIFLSKSMSISGLALSTSISTMVMAVIQYIILNKRLSFDNSHLFGIFIKSILASSVMIFFVIVLRNYLYAKIGIILMLFILTIVGVSLYLLILVILKTDEVKQIFQILKLRKVFNEEN